MSPEEELKTLRARLATVTDDNQRLRTEIALLRQKLDALARRIFGKKSEQLSPEQMMLLLAMGEDLGLGKQDGPEEKQALPPRPKGAKSRTRRQPLPEHLPVIEEIIEPEPVKADPKAWRRIGEEVSERLDYEPGRFLRRRTVRPKYVKRNVVDAAPVIAPLPGCLLERSILTPGLLATILGKISRGQAASIDRLIWENTSVDLNWISERLAMSSAANASQQICRSRSRERACPKPFTNG